MYAGGYTKPKGLYTGEENATKRKQGEFWVEAPKKIDEEKNKLQEEKKKLPQLEPLMMPKRSTPFMSEKSPIKDGGDMVM